MHTRRNTTHAPSPQTTASAPIRAIRVASFARNQLYLVTQLLLKQCFSHVSAGTPPTPNWRSCEAVIEDSGSFCRPVRGLVIGVGLPWVHFAHPRLDSAATPVASELGSRGISGTQGLRNSLFQTVFLDLILECCAF